MSVLTRSFPSPFYVGRHRRKTLTAAVATVMLLAAWLVAGSGGIPASAQSPSGAIFTTTPDGGIVNANVQYTDKRQVYLDGGPPPNAPASAAGLDDGLYVFQVTDPSGKFLLSQDPAKCRIVRVEGGLIVELVAPSTLGLSDAYGNGNGNGNGVTLCHIQDEPDGAMGASGRHDTNTDADHGDQGAIVVQLMPYGTTTNPGGVYKAWVTPLDSYRDHGGDLNTIPSKLSNGQQKPQKCPDFCAAADPGFGPPRGSVKTDNFKVKLGAVEPAATLNVLKFNDRNGNGVWDDGEPQIEGWLVDVTDPLDVTNTYGTPASIVAEPPGDYEVDEENPAGWVHTVTLVDGVSVGIVDPVTVNVPAGGERTVAFGNFQPSSIEACKFYDFDRDGEQAGDLEVDLSGWPMTLEGLTFEGDPVGPVTESTGADGCVVFEELIEGSYTVTEGTPLEADWSHTTDPSVDVELEAGAAETVTFGNVCVTAFEGGLTMGYWKTHTGLDSPSRDATYDQLPIMLGIEPDDGYPEALVTDEGEARDIFDAATCGDDDCLPMLRAQLLAAKLNVLKFPGFENAELPGGAIVGDVIAQADQILDDFANGIPHDKAEIVQVKDLLDAANNNGSTGILTGPSPEPCPATFAA